MNINVDFAIVAGGKGFPRSLGTFFLNPCFHAVALFRLSSLLYRARLEPLAKIVWCVNRMLYHVDLDYKARLAPGFRLVHGLGVVIGAGVVSDGPLTVYQGVTIGGSHGRHREDGRGGGSSGSLISGATLSYTLIPAFLAQYISGMVQLLKRAG